MLVTIKKRHFYIARIHNDLRSAMATAINTNAIIAIG